MKRSPHTFHLRRASVIVVVLVTMAFAALALVVFIEKASNDLIVDTRERDAARMRLEAYSAMETVIATLEDYRSVIGSLHSPAEGWADPLGFADYTPINPVYTVEVAFEDESGKLSLPNVNSTTLTNLFTYWGFDTDTTAKLVDALLGWMKPSYVPTSAGSPQPEDYNTGDLPFLPPARTLRSFDELYSINYIRDIFFDENGRPNDYYRRFVATFSLYNFSTTNINAAAPDVMGALGSQDPALDQKLADFLSGADNHAANGAAGYFASKDEVNTFLGAGTPGAQLGITINALRIIVTVRSTQGPATYRLNVLVSMPGSNGAKVPAAWSQVRSPDAVTTTGTTTSSSAASQTTSANSTTSNAGSSQAAGLGTSNAPAQNLKYPYTFLEVLENDTPPGPPSTISTTATNANLSAN